jgi:predicted branched-subunit amino acid permease
MAAIAEPRARLTDPASVGAGVRAVAPLLPAVAAFAVSFGLLARNAGVGAVPSFVMSATTFAGSAQFAFVAALGAGGGGLAAGIVAAVLLNLRYLPIGLSVAQAVPGPGWLRLLRAQLVVDESWALGAVAQGRWAPGRLLGAGLALYACWVAGTIAGILGGGLLGDPSRLGLDAAFPALFLALVVGQLRGDGTSSRALLRPRLAALAGATIALVTLPFAPPGVPLVCAAAACGIAFLPPRPRTVDA